MTSELLLLLPPSETKSDGGSRISTSLVPEDPALHAVFEEVRDDLIELSQGPVDAAARALKISAKLAASELGRNRNLLHPLVKPAAERYTGVLYDALDAASLSVPEREWLDRHVLIHSALYGPISTGAEIAAYRLSHDSRLPGAPLRSRWAPVVTSILADHAGPILDLRSKGYVGLGPLPSDREDCVWGEVVERLADGSFRSLNHFNKQAKGRFVRLLARRGVSRALHSLADVAASAAPEFTVERLDAHTLRIIPEADSAGH